MAATAKVNGIVIDAARVAAAAWTELALTVRRKEATVIMPYCGCHGLLATSSLGNNFFRHYAEATQCIFATAAESPEHLFAKYEAAAGARDAGWEFRVEQPSPTLSPSRWRADVLAWLPGRASRTALEIQNSRQAPAAYVDRTRRYNRDDVEALWFAVFDPAAKGRMPSGVRVFDLVIGFEDAVVTYSDADLVESKPLRRFVAEWLAGWRPAEPVGPIVLLEEVRSPAPRANPWARASFVPVPRELWKDTRGPSPLPQQACPNGCDPGMSLSSVLETWVCMTCRAVERREYVAVVASEEVETETI